MSIKQVAKDSVLFLIGNLANRMLSVLLIPMYTRYITPDLYGKLELMGVIGEILTILLTFGLGGALYRYYYDLEESERSRFVGTGVLISCLMSVPIVIILSINFDLYGELLFKFDQDNELFYLVLWKIPFSLIGAYLSAFMILLGQARKFVILSLISTTIALLLNILFIAWLELGIKGLLVANLISAILQIVMYYIPLRDYIIVKFARIYVMMQLRFGTPLIIAGISSWIMSSANRFFLQEFSTLREIGLYSLAQKFAVTLQFTLITPIVQAWSRSAFEHQNSPDLDMMSSRMMRLYVSSVLLLGVLSSLALPTILTILTTPEYYGAAAAYPFLVGSFFCFGLNRMFEIPLHLKNRSGLSGVLGSVAMGYSLFFNWILVPRYGMVGAAIATWAAYFINNFNYYLAAKRINPMPYPMLGLLLMSWIAILICVVGLVPSWGIFAVGVRFVLGIVFTGVVVRWNKDEIPQLLISAKLILQKFRISRA